MFGDLPAGLALSLVAKGVAGSIKYVAQLDGAMQNWQLSDPIVIPANIDFKLTFTLSGTGNTLEGILDGNGAWLRFLREADINFFNENAQMDIAGTTFALLALANGDTRDGTVKKISIFRENGTIYSKINNEEPRQDRSSAPGGFTITELCKYSTSYFAGVFYDFEVEIDGVLTNQIPLTNKAQGATQLATVGNVNAFMPNYTNAVWRKP